MRRMTTMFMVIGKRMTTMLMVMRIRTLMMMVQFSRQAFKIMF